MGVYIPRQDRPPCASERSIRTLRKRRFSTENLRTTRRRMPQVFRPAAGEGQFPSPESIRILRLQTNGSKNAEAFFSCPYSDEIRQAGVFLKLPLPYSVRMKHPRERQKFSQYFSKSGKYFPAYVLASARKIFRIFFQKISVPPANPSRPAVLHPSQSPQSSQQSPGRTATYRTASGARARTRRPCPVQPNGAGGSSHRIRG